MENGLFSSSEFAEWSKSYVIYCHISTRIEGRKDEGLFREKGFTGFPTLAFLDTNGALTAKHAGSRVIPELNKTAKKSTTYMTLRSKANAGDKAAKQHLFVADLELGRYDFASGSLKLAVLRKQMSDSLQNKAAQLLIDTQYKELRSRLSKELLAGLDRQEYTRRYQAMNVDFYQAGQLPSGSTAMSILMGVMRSGFQNKDEALLSGALQEFKTRAATQANYARYVGRYEDMLTQLREGK